MTARVIHIKQTCLSTSSFIYKYTIITAVIAILDLVSVYWTKISVHTGHISLMEFILCFSLFSMICLGFGFPNSFSDNGQLTFQGMYNFQKVFSLPFKNIVNYWV